MPRVSRSTKSRRSWQSGKSKYWTFIKKVVIIVKYKENQPHSSRPESESEITTKSSNNSSQVWKDLGEEVWFDKKEKRRKGSFFFLSHGKRELDKKISLHFFLKDEKKLFVAKMSSHSFLKVAQTPDPPLVTLKPTNRGNFHCRSHHSAFKCPHNNFY